MNFIPALHPPKGPDRPQWWFLFRKDRILVRDEGNHPVRPFLTNVSMVESALVRKQYLGNMNGTDCYTAEIRSEVLLPSNSRLRPIRWLLGEVEDDILAIAGRANQMVQWAQTHQYCGRCGHPTEDSHAERAKICNNCSLINYPRISPAVIVAVIKNRRILLARSIRAKSSYQSVLAGFVEPGETLEDCVRREVNEEVGIRVKNIRYFGSQPWPFPNALMVGFTAVYAGGDLKVDQSEIIDADWFDACSLPRVPGKWSISRQLIDWFSETFG
jgi:NAD+ diphosphatase